MLKQLNETIAIVGIIILILGSVMSFFKMTPGVEMVIIGATVIALEVTGFLVYKVIENKASSNN